MENKFQFRRALVLASRMKCHRLHYLNNILPFLEVGKSKIKVPANLVCDESLLAGLQMTSLFCPPLAERVQVVVSSFLIKVSSFLIKDTNPTLGAPPL